MRDSLHTNIDIAEKNIQEFPFACECISFDRKIIRKKNEMEDKINRKYEQKIAKWISDSTSS